MDHHPLPDVPKDVVMSDRQVIVENSGQPSPHPAVEELRSIIRQGCGSVQSQLEAWMQREVEKTITSILSPVKESDNKAHTEHRPDLLNQYGGSTDNDVQRSADQEMRQEMRTLTDQLSTLNGTKLFDKLNTISMRLDGMSSQSGQLPSQREADLQNQLSLQKENNKKLQERMSSLRNALIKTQPQVLDSTVSDQFLRLKNSINHLVRSTFEIDLTEIRIDPLSEDKRWFGPFRTKKKHIQFLPNTIRSLIFNTLYIDIFSRPYYGSAYGKGLEKQERNLSSEMALGHLHLRDFVDWRSASIKCTEVLENRYQAESNSGDARDYQSKIPEFIHHTAKDIWAYLSPLKLKRGRDGKKGFEQVQKICEDAYRVNELMRRARDVFTVEWEQSVSGLEINAMVEEESSERDSLGRDGQIACWTFGALTKRTEENPKIPLVIEKAQVVVYRSQ